LISTRGVAGFDRSIVAAIVGQEVGNITDDLYSGGPSDGRKRECVEAVKLPTQVLPAVRIGALGM
jgi:hypothetical protein